MVKCSVSLWSGDLKALGSEVTRLEHYADSFHFDVADGHFTNTLLFFPDLIRSLRRLTRIPFDVHIMCRNPGSFVDMFAEAGADVMCIQYEAAKESIRDVVEKVRVAGMTPALAIGVETPVTVLAELAALVERVTIMGTKIGIKGQPLQPATYRKIHETRSLLEELGRNEVEIEADGGIREDTVKGLTEAGADILVLGSLAFQNDLNTVFPWLRSL